MLRRGGGRSTGVYGLVVVQGLELGVGWNVLGERRWLGMVGRKLRRGLQGSSGEGGGVWGGVTGGCWRSAGGDVDRWWVLGESAGVGPRRAWALLSADLDDKGRGGCASEASWGASIEVLACAVDCRARALGAALPSMAMRGSLGMGLWGAWASSLGIEDVDWRVGVAGGGSAATPAGWVGGGAGPRCPTSPGVFSPFPSIEFGPPPGGRLVSTARATSGALGGRAGPGRTRVAVGWPQGNPEGAWASAGAQLPLASPPFPSSSCSSAGLLSACFWRSRCSAIEGGNSSWREGSPAR